MKTRLHFDILSQPDGCTCGPTCLHAVYEYYEHGVPLREVISQLPRLRNGGTMAVHLANHALRRGYRARIYSFNLQMFDPTWFKTPHLNLSAKLREQALHKAGHRFESSSKAYLEFIERGGDIRFEDLTTNLIRRFLNRGIPILTGLSSTWLYQACREFGPADQDDDVRGHPAGHFVVLCGYSKADRTVIVADPLHPNPFSPDSRYYEVDISRLLTAVLLGVLTYDADMLIIQPKKVPGGTIY